MKHGPVGPEERKEILRKIYHALRQSPMFTHYSVEHIRDSAIKSEQLTFDRSHTKQEYMTAMNMKLAKIEKSYVMNTEEILREIGNKTKHINTEQHPINNGPMRMYRETGNMMHNTEISDEYSGHTKPPGPAGQEFIPLTSNSQGREINFSFIKDEGRGHIRNSLGQINNIAQMQIPNLSLGLSGANGYKAQNSHAGHLQMGQRGSGGINRINMQPEGHVNGFTGALASSTAHMKAPPKTGIYAGGMGGYSTAQGPMNRVHNSAHMANIMKIDTGADLLGSDHKKQKQKIAEIPEIGLSRDTVNTHSREGHIRQIDPFAPLGSGGPGDISSFSVLRDPGRDIHGMGLGGLGMNPSMHRSGSAGSTNTVTKLNNSRMAMHIERSGKSVKNNNGQDSIRAEEKAKQKEKEKADDLLVEAEEEKDLKEKTPEEIREIEWKEELAGILCEIEEMKEVVETHRSIFSRWEKKREVFYGLEKMIEQTAQEQGTSEGAERVQGIYQELKKHVITLSKEIKEGKSLTFKKRLGRISGAFMQKQRAQPEYQFMSTEELLLEYN